MKCSWSQTCHVVLDEKDSIPSQLGLRRKHLRRALSLVARVVVMVVALVGGRRALQSNSSGAPWWRPGREASLEGLPLQGPILEFP